MKGCEINKINSLIKSCQGENGLRSFMTGVLFVDARQDRACEYILRYLSDFDRESGEYIDFYLPGYVEKGDVACRSEQFEVMIGGRTYYFQPHLYEEAQEQYEHREGVRRSRYPQLVLIDVEKENGRYVFRQKLVIDLKEYMKNSTIEVEDLFYRIFDYARANSDMGVRQYNFKFRVLLGNHVPKIKEFLVGQISGLIIDIAMNAGGIG